MADGRAEQRARESGYGILLRNVAASIEASDPDAAQALARAAVTVEELVRVAATLRQALEEIDAWETDRATNPKETNRTQRIARAALAAAGETETETT